MPRKAKNTPISIDMSTRSYQRVPTSIDVETRSFDIIITTETPVRTYIRNPEQPEEFAADTYIEVDEILLASGLDTSRVPGMPLVDTHATHDGINKILGKVDGVRVEGTDVIGRATLNSRNADLITDIRDGFYNQISAGFGVNAYEIEHRDGDVPLAYATSWTLFEASLVPVGADLHASVRSAKKLAAPSLKFRNQENSETQKMDKIEELIAAAEDAVEVAEAAVVAVEEAIDAVEEADIDGDLIERARKLREVAGEEEDRKREVADEDDEEVRKREADDEKKEDEELRSIRSIAKSYGLTKAVDDLAALGTRSKDIKAAVRSAIMQKASGTSGSRSDIEPRKRSAEPKLTSFRDIYANMNKR